jgi:pantothenate kinase type III
MDRPYYRGLRDGYHFDLVNGKGQYCGGVIAPGVMISAEALFQKASKFPESNS